ncbi:MAG: 5'-methylthioadenosine/S-adenosylhomocysteine nucleosidase [Oligoflexia bacterium]|nr:5'-methylthioadenosine/S-adenosylhomocysteine nucleosidase [Oligoflexia bacterium]
MNIKNIYMNTYADKLSFSSACKLYVFLLIFLISLLANTTTSNASELKTILILTAMELEENAIIEKLHLPFKEIVADDILETKYKMAIINGSSKDKDLRIILSHTGVGMVNASTNLYSIIKDFNDKNQKQKIDLVIVSGVAGSLQEKLKIGDVVIANRLIQHDSFVSSDTNVSEDTSKDCQQSQSSTKLDSIKKLMAPGEFFVADTPDGPTDPALYPDKQNFQLLSRITQNMFDKESDNQVHIGTILTGSSFAGSSKQKMRLAKLVPNAYAVDMEVVAVAQMCKKLKIPFVAFKTISDRYNPKSGVITDYKTFSKKAAQNAGRVISLFINQAKE